MQWQEVLGREQPPLIWSLIDETALHREVGTLEVMHGQFQHLADLSRHPNITIQVVPCSAGPHSGLLGAFVIAELDDSPPIAYLETAAEGETVEDPSMLARLALTFDNLRSKALPDVASTDLIVKVAEERSKHELPEEQLQRQQRRGRHRPRRGLPPRLQGPPRPGTRLRTRGLRRIRGNCEEGRAQR